MGIQALRERKDELAKQANNMIANAGDKVWSKEEAASYDQMTDEIGRINAQIKAITEQAQLDAEKLIGDAAKNSKKTTTLHDAVALYLRKGMNLSAQELAMVQNAMSTTTGSEGGFTVPTEIATMVIDALKTFGGMRSVANIIRSSAGNDWQYPASDGTSEVGEIVGQKRCRDFAGHHVQPSAAGDPQIQLEENRAAVGTGAGLRD